VSRPTLFSIGHGDRSTEELIALLQEHAIAQLVDIRAKPGSRRHPWFGMDPLRSSLEQAGIVYHWAGRQLGGFREPQPDSEHLALKGSRLQGYADYMETQAFGTAATQLINLARRGPTAMLCAERLPEHCHRSLIADYLLLQGVEVLHLIDPGSPPRPHLLHPAARRESARLVYDRQAQLGLGLDGQ